MQLPCFTGSSGVFACTPWIVAWFPMGTVKDI
jgi:hypothetical protein